MKIRIRASPSVIVGHPSGAYRRPDDRYGDAAATLRALGQNISATPGKILLSTVILLL